MVKNNQLFVTSLARPQRTHVLQGLFVHFLPRNGGSPRTCVHPAGIVGMVMRARSDGDVERFLVVDDSLLREHHLPELLHLRVSYLV